jgi:V-type H+-transporting ATPase subunit C
LTLSDTLPKHDAYFTSTVSKLLDTIKSLATDPQAQANNNNNTSKDDKDKLESYARVNDIPPTQYLIPRSGSNEGGWSWDKARWGNDGKVTEVVDALVKVSASTLTCLFATL